MVEVETSLSVVRVSCVLPRRNKACTGARFMSQMNTPAGHVHMSLFQFKQWSTPQ